MLILVENREFVEIYNPGPVPISLANLSVDFINGANGQPYASYPLNTDHQQLPGFGYLVLGDRAMAESLAPDVLFVPINSRQTEHDIQNGNPDGFQLLDGDVVIDSMSFAGEIDGVTEGEAGAPDDRNDEQ